MTGHSPRRRTARGRFHEAGRTPPYRRSESDTATNHRQTATARNHAPTGGSGAWHRRTIGVLARHCCPGCSAPARQTHNQQSLGTHAKLQARTFPTDQCLEPAQQAAGQLDRRLVVTTQFTAPRCRRRRDPLGHRLGRASRQEPCGTITLAPPDTLFDGKPFGASASAAPVVAVLGRGVPCQRLRPAPDCAASSPLYTMRPLRRRECGPPRCATGCSRRSSWLPTYGSSIFATPNSTGLTSVGSSWLPPTPCTIRAPVRGTPTAWSRHRWPADPRVGMGITPGRASRPGA